MTSPTPIIATPETRIAVPAAEPRAKHGKKARCSAISGATPSSVIFVLMIGPFTPDIGCPACGGHLGRVFLGEGFIPKNTLHGVDSISMRFVPAKLGG